MRIKTQEGHIIKILADLLCHNVKTITWKISKSGISMVSMDNDKSILICLDLRSTDFNIFDADDEELFISFQISDLYKAMKEIKKKDTLELIIDDDYLNVIITPKENGRMIRNPVKFHYAQNIDIGRPDLYKDSPIVIQSSDFQKSCKSIFGKGDQLTIYIANSYIKLISTTENIFKSEIYLGDLPTTLCDKKTTEHYNFIDSFSQLKFAKCQKITGLSSKIKIYHQEDSPLLLETNVGTLGTLSIYIKSIKQMT